MCFLFYELSLSLDMPILWASKTQELQPKCCWTKGISGQLKVDLEVRIMKKLSVLTSIFAIMFTIAVGSSDAFGQRTKPALKRKPVAQRPAATARPAAPATYAVETGTVVRVRMNSTLSSKTARVGDLFNVTVTEPVYSANGVVVVPVGSTIVGRVASVTAADKGGKVGSIDARFTQVRLPNGLTRSINGSLTDLVSSNAKSDDEGTASGDKMKNRKVIFIGGGGAGGAVLGAAIGGGKGAAIGGLLGAGAGLLGERFLKGEEAEVRSGTEFGIYLNQMIRLPRFAEATDYRIQ
jgi:hypothetical protein